jgi:hypothetical protein
MHLDDEMDFRPTSARAARFAPALYSAALFLSALLLFAIEPMFAAAADRRCRGRLVSRDGLFPGGAVARLRLRAPTQPRAVAGGHVADRPRAKASRLHRGGGEFWLLALFAASIGVPFFALAASAPLLAAFWSSPGGLAYPLSSRHRLDPLGSRRVWACT